MTNPTEKKQTIQERLDQIAEDLAALAFCCNRDQQYDQAGTIQAMLTHFGELDITCADVATWPPKVNFDKDGEPHWVCADE